MWHRDSRRQQVENADSKRKPREKQYFLIQLHRIFEWVLKAEGGELVIIVKPQKGEIR
jgi:protein required for attachment to host cells